MYSQKEINNYYTNRFKKFSKTFAGLLDEVTKQEYNKIADSIITGCQHVKISKEFLKKVYTSYERMGLRKTLKEKRYHSQQENAKINAMLLIQATITATLGTRK